MQNVSAVNSDGASLGTPIKETFTSESEEVQKGEMMQKESIIEVEKTGKSYPINNMQPFAVVNSLHHCIRKEYDPRKSPEFRIPFTSLT